MNYDVNEKGEVFNENGRILIPRKHTNGYQTVLFCNGIVQKNKYIHRLVADKYLANPMGLPEVNHIDGDKTNNRVSNLEWCNKSFNSKHAYDTGLNNIPETLGVYNGRAILNETQVLEIRSKYIPKKYTIPRLSQEYGVSYGTIQAIILRKIWKHI